MALVMNWQRLCHKVMRLVSQGNDLWHLTTIPVLSYHTPSLSQTTVLTNVQWWNLMIFVQALPKYLFQEMSKPPTVQNKLKNVPSVKFRSENSYHGWERHAESKSCHDCKTWGWTLNTEEKGTRNQNLDTIAKTGSKFKEKLQQSISVSAN